MSAPPIEPKLLGELAVVIIKAKNLPDRSKIGKHNPYVVVQYRQEKRKSKVVKKGGQHPEFDDEVRFKIYEETEDILARPPRSSDTPSSVLSSSTSTPPGNTPNALSGSAAEGKRLPLNKSIQVTVWADDSKEPRIVGECSVDLAEVFRTCEQDDSYELQYKGRYAGEISLELTYFINDAPPIPKKVAKPVIPAKPVHSQSITSISTIASFDGPAGFPLKGSSGSRRRPVQPTSAAGYGAGYANGSAGGGDPRYQQYYQQSGTDFGGAAPSGHPLSTDEWGVRPGASTSMGYPQSSASLSTVGSTSNHHDLPHHRQSFSGRPTSVVPSFDPYSHQSSVDSLGGTLSSLSIASHGPSMPFPTSTPYQAPYAAVHQSTFPPPTAAPEPQGHGHGHRYSMSGAIPQSSSWNGNPAANGGNYQPPPSSSYGTLPPLPPPPSLPMPQGYSTQIPPSSSFPQLYPPEPPATGYQQSYGASASIQPSRTPLPTDYSAQAPSNPALMPWQTSSPSQNNTSNGYQRPASTNPGSYIPPPLIDNRPPPRPSSQPMTPPSTSYPAANTAYGQLPPPPPPPGGHYPLPTSSFHYSSATPAPGNYADAQGRPLPMPAAGGYQPDSSYGQGAAVLPPPPPQLGDWRDPAYSSTQDQNGYQASNQDYNNYSAPPPVQQQQTTYSSYNPVGQSSTWDQNGQNSHWDQGSAYPSQPSYVSQPLYSGLAVPPPPPPRPHSPPAPSNVLTNAFASRNDATQGQNAGRSYLSNLGVGDQAPPQAGGYGLPPRLPDSLLGGTMPGGY